MIMLQITTGEKKNGSPLLDGQYGDYPGGDIDYDTFGFGG